MKFARKFGISLSHKFFVVTLLSMPASRMSGTGFANPLLRDFLQHLQAKGFAHPIPDPLPELDRALHFLWFSKSPRIKEEGRCTRNGYEASKGSKGISGL